MNKDPLISVIMTFYNARNTLEEAVKSILNQSFINFELLLIDDGSSDGSMEFLNTFEDIRLVYIHAGKVGRAAALNLGLQSSRGKYIAILDADDVALPNRLEDQRDFLEINSDIGLVCSSVELIDEDGHLIGVSQIPVEHEKLLERLLRLNPFAHSSVMYHRQKALNVGGYNERCEKSIDFNFYLDLISAGTKIKGQKKAYTRLRDYPSSWGKSDQQALQMYFGIIGLIDYYLNNVGEERFLRGKESRWNKINLIFKVWFESKGFRRRYDAKKNLKAAKTRLFSGDIFKCISLIFSALYLDPLCIFSRGIGFSYPKDPKHFISQIDISNQ